MKNESNYNGWKNYETWNVKLWIDNEREDYELWRKRTKAHLQGAKADEYSTKAQSAKYNLAEELKERIELRNPLSDHASMFSDLLNSALSEVNWYEIAESLINELKEERKYQETQK